MRRLQLFISIVAPFAISVVSSLSLSPPVLKPFCEATIDYSAANEYVEAHYGNLAPRTPYFERSFKEEPIYDARQGVYDDQSNCMKDTTIDSCGFTLLNKPSRVKDWTSLAQIRYTYLPELQSILQETYPDSKIRHAVFWNPMLRGQDLQQTRPDDASTPTASFAASPHIDTDVGAYNDPKDLISLFEKNRPSKDQFPTDDLVSYVKEGRRFAIVNAWRNIAETPVVRSPLALFSVQYDDQKAFPEAAPNMDRSRWYVFSDMNKDEVLLFCQYDRDVSRPSDLWHCALTHTGDPSAASRSSFDVRCFIVFDDMVPEKCDRYSDDRLASLLTQEESGCFCDQQAERRGIKQAS